MDIHEERIRELMREAGYEDSAWYIEYPSHHVIFDHMDIGMDSFFVDISVDELAEILEGMYRDHRGTASSS